MIDGYKSFPSGHSSCKALPEMAEKKDPELVLSLD